MKKLLAILLAALMLLCACAAVAEEEQPAEKVVATEFVFELAEGEGLYIENTIFPETVTINGDYGVIMFAGCEFQADVVNTANEFTRVMIFPDCTVAGKCILKNDVKEANMEYAVPKYLVFAPVEIVCEDCIGAVVALGDFELVFNGETYTLAGCELFFDAEHPENGFVPYEGQEANVFVVAQWWENGEQVIMTECEFDPTM